MKILRYRFAELRFDAVCNCTLHETDFYSAGVSFEYLREDVHGADDADIMTVQVASEF